MKSMFFYKTLKFVLRQGQQGIIGLEFIQELSQTCPLTIGSIMSCVNYKLPYIASDLGIYVVPACNFTDLYRRCFRAFNPQIVRLDHNSFSIIYTAWQRELKHQTPIYSIQRSLPNSMSTPTVLVCYPNRELTSLVLL